MVFPSNICGRCTDAAALDSNLCAE